MRASSAGPTHATGSARGGPRHAFRSRRASTTLAAAGLAALLSLAIGVGSAAAASEPPTVTLEPASAEYTTAHLVAKTESPYLVQYDFQYREFTEDPAAEGWNDGNNQPNGPFANQYPPGTNLIPEDITGLKPNTKYQFRLITFGQFGNEEYEAFITEAPYPTFTTKFVAKPVVSLDPVTAVTINSAHFSGIVHPNAPAGPLGAAEKAAYQTEWHVECSPHCPTAEAGVVLEGDDPSGAVSLDPIRLETNTFYEVSLIATNAAGSTIETKSFQTPLILPAVKSAPGGSAGAGSYNVGGIVTPFNSKITNCHFEYGPTTEYVYSAPCSPDPVGRNEVQKVYVPGLEGEFRLTFRGQTTDDIEWGADNSVVEHELQRLSVIGPDGVDEVTSETGFFVRSFVIHFSGQLSSTNLGQLHAENGTIPLDNSGGGGPAGNPSVETLVDGGNNSPVLVEAHLTGLTPGATYHYQVFATNSVGKVGSGDNLFVPPLAADEVPCPNESKRVENSSTRLAECRSYELVTSSFKASSAAELVSMGREGTIAYTSRAGNINNSGYGGIVNSYVAERHESGWETIPNLNGPRGSPFAPPYSLGQARPLYTTPDLQHSMWFLSEGRISSIAYPYIRLPDGSFEPITKVPLSSVFGEVLFAGASADLSHTLWDGAFAAGMEPFGLGVYEYVGVNNTAATRVDVDNSGEPISDCYNGLIFFPGNAKAKTISEDGRVIYFIANGCPGGKIETNELWARVDGKTSYYASASECTRTAGDLGGACNAPSDPTFEGVASDGSRVFFTTNQQLVNGDTNQTRDLYAYTLPTAANPNPANPLTDVSGTSSDAKVQEIVRVADDGSRVYFLAEGALAGNHDALDEPPRAGDHNFYVWQKTPSHPEGETKFIGQVTSAADVSNLRSSSQTTPNGRFLAYRAFTPMVETDTDNSADIYRYDADTGELIRVSTDASGVGGSGDGLDANLSRAVNEHARPNMSADGQQIVFSTSEALSADDGNGASDIYLWRGGHTSLVSTGAVGGGANEPLIDNSGDDIYFTTAQALTADDVDNVTDVYDARRNGGFSFAVVSSCAGEGCQSTRSAPPPDAAPATDHARGTGNYRPATVSIAPLSSSQRAKLAAGGRVGLTVKVSGAGTIALRATASLGKKQKQVFEASRRMVQAGQASLPVTLSNSARGQLGRTGSLKIQISAEFADAEPATSSATLKSPTAKATHSKRRGS